MAARVSSGLEATSATHIHHPLSLLLRLSRRLGLLDVLCSLLLLVDVARLVRHDAPLRALTLGIYWIRGRRCGVDLLPFLPIPLLPPDLLDKDILDQSPHTRAEEVALDARHAPRRLRRDEVDAHDDAVRGGGVLGYLRPGPRRVAQVHDCLVPAEEAVSVIYLQAGQSLISS